MRAEKGHNTMIVNILPEKKSKAEPQIVARDEPLKKTNHIQTRSLQPQSGTLDMGSAPPSRAERLERTYEKAPSICTRRRRYAAG